MDKRLLTEREFNTADFPVKDSWHSARDIFNQYQSVIDFDWFDTTSSAGDFGGYILQRLNKRVYLIPVWQVNNWPYKGFTINTGNPIASWTGEMSQDDIYSILQDHMN